MASKLQVSLIVLNWNGRRFLEPCLSSLLAQTLPDFEILLVDNGSSDGSVAFLESHYAAHLHSNCRPRLKLVKLEQNIGFAGGNLAGLAASDPTTPYVATLNNDTITAPDWLENLVAALAKADANIYGAACGPLLFASVSNQTTPIIAAAGITIYRNGLAMDGQVGQSFDPQITASREVFGPCAGAAIYRRTALDTVGFFDSAFFAYLEDADLAWRLQLAGWRTLYVPHAQVWHEYSGTGGQNSPFKNFQLGRNRVWTIFKNMPGRLLLKYLPAILLYDVAASVYTLKQGSPQAVKGRLAALHPRYWQQLWQQRRQIQKQRRVTLSYLENWLQPSPSLLQNLRLREQVNALAYKNKKPN